MVMAAVCALMLRGLVAGAGQDQTIATAADLRIQCNRTTGGGHDKVQVVGSYQVINYQGAPLGGPVPISIGPIDMNDQGNADERSVTRIGFTRLALKRGEFATMYLSLLASSDGDWLSKNAPAIAGKVASALAAYYTHDPKLSDAAGSITDDVVKGLLADSGTHFLGSMWAVGNPPITEPRDDMIFFAFPADSKTYYIGARATGIVKPSDQEVTVFGSEDMQIHDWPGPGSGIQCDFSADERGRYSVWFALENGRVRVETHMDQTLYDRGWKPGFGPAIQTGFR